MKSSFLKNVVIAIVIVCALAGVGYYLLDKFVLSDNTVYVTIDGAGGSFDASYTTVNVYCEFDGDIKNQQKLYIGAENGKLISLPKQISRTGYTFLGWFLGNEKLDKSFEATNGCLVIAKWKINVFDITYIVDGVENTIQTDYGKLPALQEPTKERTDTIGYIFEKWSPDLSVATENTTYTAVFSEHSIEVHQTNTISFEVDNLALDENLTCEVGTDIEAPVFSTSKYQMGGYGIDGWYKDKECTKKYNFTVMPFVNTTLYGKWEHLLSEGFYDKIESFKVFSENNEATITSDTELVQFIEYIEFVGDYDSITLNINAKSINENKTRVEKAYNNSTFAFTEPLAGQYYDTYCVIKLTECKFSDFSPATPVSSSSLYYQQNYAMQTIVSPIRTDSTLLGIEKITKTLQVENSTQLMYALEKGIKPICKDGSSAQSIYQSAKNILLQICTDKMSDEQKLWAIYQWLILNVQYDTPAAKLCEENSLRWQDYAPWFAEGVFDNKVAVCDGISKAFSILAGMENIPCYRVSGNSKTTNAGHAWNIVLVNGKWFNIDATQGNLLISSESYNQEILSLKNFMITDLQKGDYQRKDYLTFIANTEFDSYGFFSYSYLLYDFDLDINSETELFSAIRYANENKQAGSKYATIECKLSYNYENETKAMQRINLMTGISIKLFSTINEDKHIYCFFLQNS